jgi:hypothetical protein
MVNQSFPRLIATNKSSLSVFIGLIIFSLQGIGQILISNNPADTLNKSALLEVKSNDKGFLPPVMSSVSRRGILNPAQGLMVFDSTKQRMFVFTKEGWKPLIFGIDSSDFGQPEKPLVADLSTGDNLGVSTAIGKEYAIAGAYGDDINGKADQGSVYVFKKQDGKWVYYTKITASDGQAGDYFGAAVAISDDYIFVGASGNNTLENNDEGSVYVYKILDGTIQFQQKIRGIGAGPEDRFGYSIDVQGKDLVVGVPFDDIGSNANQGAVYFFSRSEAGQYLQYQKYFLPTGQASDQFGFGLSLDSNQLSVGNEIVTSGEYGYSQNAVNILTRIEGIWVHQAKINQPDGLDKREAFGYTTNLQGDILVVGAWLHDIPSGNKDRGAAYVFKRNSGNWQFIQKIAPPDVSEGSPGNTYGDYFGYSISRDKNNLLIGAHWEDYSPSLNDRGALYLYELIGNEFILKKQFKIDNAQNLELFSYSNSILDDDIMVGAIGRDSFTGAVYFIGKN